VHLIRDGTTLPGDVSIKSCNDPKEEMVVDGQIKSCNDPKVEEVVVVIEEQSTKSHDGERHSQILSLVP
jgi:hypothetical protein